MLHSHLWLWVRRTRPGLLTRRTIRLGVCGRLTAKTLATRLCLCVGTLGEGGLSGREEMTTCGSASERPGILCSVRIRCATIILL